MAGRWTPRRIALCAVLSLLSIWGPWILFLVDSGDAPFYRGFLHGLLGLLSLPVVGPLIGCFMYTEISGPVEDLAMWIAGTPALCSILSVLLLAGSAWLMMRGKRWIVGVAIGNIALQLFGVAGCLASAAV